MSDAPNIAPDYLRLTRDRVLVAEANHRIANSLSAIAAMVRLTAADSSNVRQLRSPTEVRNLLQEIGARIDTAAQLHRMLANSEGEGEIALPDFLLEIAASIVAANAREGTMRLDPNLVAQCKIPADKALAVGMIVAELVTNAIKYAHPTGVCGAIQLSCEAQDGEIVAEVADDGVGLPQGFNPHAATTTGFTLIRGLAEELGAQLSFHQGGTGLRVRLSIAARNLGCAA